MSLTKSQSNPAYKIRTLGAVMCFFALILAFYRFAPFWRWFPHNHMGNLIAYPIEITFLASLIYFFKLPTRRFLRLPRFNLYLLPVVFIGSLVSSRISFKDAHGHSAKQIILGLLAVAFIAIAEELESRIISIGLFERFGTIYAVTASSIIFGLLHLNLYIGSKWDGWSAYAHVLQAFAAGVLFASFMYATKSVWVPIFFHAAWDWPIAFRDEKASAAAKTVKHIHHSWQANLFTPIGYALWNIVPAVVIFFFVLWNMKKEASVTKSEAPSVVQVM